jgi:hypothetical protein
LLGVFDRRLYPRFSLVISARFLLVSRFSAPYIHGMVGPEGIARCSWA